MMEKRNVATERRVVEDDGLDEAVKEAADAFAAADEIRKEVSDMSKEARSEAEAIFASADRARKAALEARKADEAADEDTLGLR